MLIILYYIYVNLLYTSFISFFYNIRIPYETLLIVGYYYKNPKIGTKNSFLNSRSRNHELIIGGDLEDPPSIVKDVQTKESMEFVKKCWENKVDIRDSLNLLNSLPEKAGDEIIENLLYEKNPGVEITKSTEFDHYSGNENHSSKTESSSLGIVETEPIYDHESYEESHEEDVMEVDYGLLSDLEISIISRIISEKVKNSKKDYKSEALKVLKEKNPLNLTNETAQKLINKLDKISDLFINLNKNTERNLLDISWIPSFESKLYRFLKKKGYTLSTATWTEDSLVLVLADKNIPEDEISDIHDSLQSYIKVMSRTESFQGLENIGLMVSGDDP